MAHRRAIPTRSFAPPDRMSFEEFRHWVPAGVQAEWVDGEVIVLTSTARHARLRRLLLGVLGSFTTMTGLGEVFGAPVLMRARPGGPGREPDILVLRPEHLHRFARALITGPVDLAIELVSDESVTTDRIAKREEYAAAGVPEHIVLDAREGRREFIFYRLNANGAYDVVSPDDQGRYHSAVLPGFWFDPRWFDEEPLPSPETLLFEIAGDRYATWLGTQRRSRSHGDH